MTVSSTCGDTRTEKVKNLTYLGNVITSDIDLRMYIGIRLAQKRHTGDRDTERQT